MSRNRDIASFLGKTEAENTTNVSLGAGGGGGLDWQSTIQDSSFTAETAKGYFVNTTDGEVIVTLPSSPEAGDEIGIFDHGNNASTNSILFNPNGTLMQGLDSNSIHSISTNGQGTHIVYSVDSPGQGWVTFTAANPSDTGPIRSAVPVFDARYLAVGGGGGGGGGWGVGGGGGGAGGFDSGIFTYTPGVAYTITVGAGGAGAGEDTIATTGAQGDSGGASRIVNSVTSEDIAFCLGGGGGGGLISTNAYLPGASGASGGGGGGGVTAVTAGVDIDPNSTGNAGGAGQNDAGGGGGGAGAVGAAGVNFGAAGAGGAGLYSNIYTGVDSAYAGGGGGGTDGGAAQGAGGIGGGGAGGKDGGPNAVQGTDGRGGGGGGGNDDRGDPGLYGADGGNGVVIIRGTAAAASTTGSPTLYSFDSGGSTFYSYKFTSSGNITY